MNKTEEVIGHLLSNSQHVSAMVTDDTEVWETHNKLVEHIRELDRKAEAFDEIESIHLNMFGDTVREITVEEAENFGMSVMRVLKIGEDK